MKILQITAVDFTVEKFLLPLIDEHINEGDEVHIACSCGKIADGLLQKGYIIHDIPFSRSLNFIKHIMALIKLVGILRREKYHCLHAHTPVASIIARLAGKIAKIPVILYTAHGFYFHENMNPVVYNIAYHIEKIWGKYFTDYIFFQSAEDYQLAVEKKFNKKDRLLHIGNGVSNMKFDPQKYHSSKMRELLGLSATDIVFIYVGRLVREKGLIELIEAFNHIRLKDAKAKLIIVGGKVEGDRDGIDLESVLVNIATNVRNDIQLLGSRSDIPFLLSGADIFVLPSYREGLPRSIIEAMAMKKPVIATNIRGCREEVFEGINGYLCEPRNSLDLAEKMMKYIDNTEFIERHGAQSRKIFLEEFDESVVIGKQITIFNKIKEEFVNV